MKKILYTSRNILYIFLLIFLLFAVFDQLAPLPTPFSNNSSDKFAKIIVAQDGTPMRAFADHKGVWRYPVSINDVSQRYIETLLAYEDRWFWFHPGINPLAMLRAMKQNLINGRIISGGSTLTMQVARIIDPHSRTISGKLKQAFRALQLEWHYSKSEILTMYLNLAPFGGPIEGVQAASFAYLSKSAKELSLAEAALLSVLPQSPSRFRPDRHPQKATSARNKVLQRLHRFGYITLDEFKDAKLEIVVPQLNASPMLAPILARRLKNKSQQGKPLVTTIDANLQFNLESLVKDYSYQLSKKSSAAVLVVNHHTMAVKAYVASSDFHDKHRYGQVDMIQAIRSPGSTLKPFLYAMALDQGLISSHSMLVDKKINVAGYKPENFSQSFSGAVSVSEALQRSLNIPAVQVLQFLGPGFFHSKLENSGLTLKMPIDSRPNLSMILGGAGTRLEELVVAYTAFSREGKTSQLIFTKDELISDVKKKETHLMSPGAAWIIHNILSKIPYRNRFSEIVNHSSNDTINSKDKLLAWKTGTSYGFRDAWAIGMTSDYTIGIWTGRPDGTPVPGHYGAQTAVPLLKAVSQNLSVSVESYKSEKKRMIRPESVTQKSICWPSGELLEQTELARCEKQVKAWILDETIPPVLAVNPELETVFDELNITSISNGAHIKKPEGIDEDLSINLEAQGGLGNIYWFVNGQVVNHQATRSILSYTFSKSGQYIINAIDKSGQSAEVTLFVQI
ncbi:MAG: penicillin-binding protein 1C [Gammaproteobacteria bacterium]|nr:penicillin-binding protein 1C [Gammaproteobacteria bacterium]